SLDADFLSSMPGSVRYAREFAASRRVHDGRNQMNRLYVLESTPSITAAKADHRWALPAGKIAHVARIIAAAVGVGEVKQGINEGSRLAVNSLPLAALAKDLQHHQRKSLVIAGDEQPAEVHVLAHAMNHALDNIGETVTYTDPVEANPVAQMES